MTIEIALFGRFLRPYSTNMVQYCRNPHQRWYSGKQKHYLKIFWRILRDGPKVSTFGPTLTPLFLLKMIKIEKKQAVVRKNFSHWAIQICQNESLSHLPFPGKTTITFCNIWDKFTRKQSRIASQRGRIKIWQILFHPHDSWSASCKKILVQIFSSFAAIDHKGHSTKILTLIFKLGWFS